MERSEGSGSQWLKYSCLGCLGIVAMVLVAAAVIAGLAWSRAGTARVEDRVMTPDLAAPEERPGLPPEAIADDIPGAAPLLAGLPAGRVVLEFSDGDFHIDPGPPGQPVRIEATYDLNSYALEESLDKRDDGTWGYTVRFHRTGSWSVIGMLAQLIGGNSPEVHVTLPPDAPLDLDLNLRHGGARIDLGGLWLKSADLDVAMGGFDVRFTEPLRAPMDRLSIETSMGGGAFGFIGNASPRELDIASSMGGVALDLSGRWMEDARIQLSSDMGGASVRLPDGVRIQGLETAGRNRTEPAGAPILTFDIQSDMDAIEFEDQN